MFKKLLAYLTDGAFMGKALIFLASAIKVVEVIKNEFGSKKESKKALEL